MFEAAIRDEFQQIATDRQQPYNVNLQQQQMQMGMGMGMMTVPAGNPQTHRSNFNSNDGTVLQNRIRELQEELDLLGAEELELENEAEILRDETDNIKRHNKALFDQITTNQEKQMLTGVPTHPSNDITINQNSLFSAANESLQQSTVNDNSVQQQHNLSYANQTASKAQISVGESAAAATAKLQESSVGDIHSLYQDLFLTDIKREVENAQNELKSCKQEQNNAQREFTALKKENAQLGATLKRYRRQLQELS